MFDSLTEHHPLAASAQGVSTALLMRTEPGSIPGRPAKQSRTQVDFDFRCAHSR